jgi:hypothetical protein
VLGLAAGLMMSRAAGAAGGIEVVDIVGRRVRVVILWQVKWLVKPYHIHKQ